MEESKIKRYKRLDLWGKADGIAFGVVENMQFCLEKYEGLLQNRYNPVSFIPTVALIYDKKDKK